MQYAHSRCPATCACTHICATHAQAQQVEEEVGEFHQTQMEVALHLEAREEKGSRILQRSYRSHVARTIYKNERFVQLESPANIIVGAANFFFGTSCHRLLQTRLGFGAHTEEQLASSFGS